MSDRRKPKQSQLDYLWTTFGEYAIASSSDEKDALVSTELLQTLNLDNSKSISSLEIVDNRLVGKNPEGKILCDIIISDLIGSYSKKEIDDKLKDVSNSYNWIEL